MFRIVQAIILTTILAIIFSTDCKAQPTSFPTDSTIAWYTGMASQYRLSKPTTFVVMFENDSVVARVEFRIVDLPKIASVLDSILNRNGIKSTLRITNKF